MGHIEIGLGVNNPWSHGSVLKKGTDWLADTSTINENFHNCSRINATQSMSETFLTVYIIVPLSFQLFYIIKFSLMAAQWIIVVIKSMQV